MCWTLQEPVLFKRKESSSGKKMNKIISSHLSMEGALLDCLNVLVSLCGHGYGEKPLMLLNTKDKPDWEIVEAYLTRWRIEETIRFAKQAFDMENVRLLMAALSFNMTYLSLKTKIQVIFTKALQATKTLFGVSDFHYHTLASGFAHVFRRAPKPKSKPPTPPSMPPA